MSWTVIIPVINEEASLPELILNLRTEMPEAVWLFVDGGSTDRTRELVEAEPQARFEEAPRGRGAQLAHGVDRATSQFVLMMHADCHLAPGARKEMEGLLADDRVAAGAFQLKILHDDLNYRLMERMVVLRCETFGLPYGDQGMFMKRETLVRAGGVEPLPLMEDVALVRQLKKLGSIKIADLPILTTPRRYENRGFWKCSIFNVILVLLFLAGCSPRTLQRLYG